MVTDDREQLDSAVPQQQIQRARSVGWQWVLVAVVVTAAVSVGVCALVLPDKAPQLLDAPSSVNTAPVARQTYEGRKQVSVIPQMSAKRELVSNTSGTLTSLSTSSTLKSGQTAFSVNDRPVLALALETPPYRELKIGDTGNDVKALNVELSRLGYSSSYYSTSYTAATAAGWHQLLKDNGLKPEGDFTVDSMVWLPAPAVNISSWAQQTGMAIQSGAPIAEVPGSVLKLSIKNGPPLDREQTLTIFGETGKLPAGTIETTDADFCNRVAAKTEFAAYTAEELKAGLDGSLAFAQPVEVLRVPAAAIVGIKESKGCIVSEGKSRKVSIVGSELGVSLVQVEEESAQGSVQIQQVDLGARLAQVKCS
ncbi:hypothetical protein KIMH_12720 [Bombiscardovia apis]|uniref:Peptidoglycan-binding protein n=1 Tax=Bombiscardovia apis TaxID=2932182 RepID=A0ABM8BED2_9BIFI|nr:hypothetical protein [Bombiscardovia apis]BDR55161.1 hypothetical protein KIMH_12720 [Bombiscardovia apis]